jgi:hypothetical protein
LKGFDQLRIVFEIVDGLQGWVSDSTFGGGDAIDVGIKCFLIIAMSEDIVTEFYLTHFLKVGLHSESPFSLKA